MHRLIGITLLLTVICVQGCKDPPGNTPAPEPKTEEIKKDNAVEYRSTLPPD